MHIHASRSPASFDRCGHLSRRLALASLIGLAVLPFAPSAKAHGTDQEQIQHAMMATFDKPNNPLKVAPVVVKGPDGHPKLLHLWPPKLPQAGRLNYQLFGPADSDFLSW